MAGAPLVSIVVTNHNYGRFLAEAVRSALSQSHPRCEVLVVDDGSTDGSREVLRGLPVKALLQENRGFAAAASRGIREARGTYHVVLSADDVLHPDFVAHCLAALESRPEASFAYTSAYLYGPHVGLLGRGALFRARPFSREMLGRGNYILGTALVRRSDFLDAGDYDGSLPLLEDWDHWLRMAGRGCIGVPVGQPLFNYRHHAPRTRNKARRKVIRATWKAIQARHGIPRRRADVLLHGMRRAIVLGLALASRLSPQVVAAHGWRAFPRLLPGPVLVPVPMEEAVPRPGALRGGW